MPRKLSAMSTPQSTLNSYHSRSVRPLRRTRTSARTMFASLCSFFFSSRRRHTRSDRDWSSDVCSSDLIAPKDPEVGAGRVDENAVAGGAEAGNLRLDRALDGLDAREPKPRRRLAHAQIGRASCRERV